jgi:predicted DNA-binding transcriptional regulator AlpA
MTDRPLNYPPPWMDMVTLCKHTCLSSATVDNWVAQGILPAPRKRGGKLMWKWAEVDQFLDNGGAGGSPDALAERIKNGTRQEATGRAGH